MRSKHNLFGGLTECSLVNTVYLKLSWLDNHSRMQPDDPKLVSAWDGTNEYLYQQLFYPVGKLRCKLTSN